MRPLLVPAALCSLASAAPGGLLRARALTPSGNASQPGSPHPAGRLELFARDEPRPVWRKRAEVEAYLVRRERF